MICDNVVTVRSSVAYQPIYVNRKRCRFHPSQTNCVLLQADKVYDHYTMMDMRYCSPNGDPYYEWLLDNNNDNNNTIKREKFQSANTLICKVKFTKLQHNEILRGVEEAGEMNIEIIRDVLRELYNYIYNDKTGLNGHANETDYYDESKVYVLFNKMYISCVYSINQCIILPQEMYCLFKNGLQPKVTRPFEYFSVPENMYSVVSQHIYKSFILYNTALTMMLNQPNPFNDTTKVISKIIESVGVCDGGVEGGKKTRIKVCALKFGGSNAPCNHVMCPPKEMVKKIYKYTKWRLNPKLYTRYYDMLGDNDKPKSVENAREWSVFLINFKNYLTSKP
ncbi:vp1054 [Cnaphalocrocis medinalis granulovirus]|uniref:Vp1054 n=2 Tax=Cnaphalocrocis medinalis granulovirus TaxID=1750712 RepID=A0A120L171_9BBAC|nr:vp1054 [Cnaphalocrocis medinalis granulovirus]AMF83867.1 vp1054 [Cnaphalocrocis medinalis granulovirus]WPN08750.1 vp1054 [Cnaphalocrocis medinalis granulovirus]